MLHDWPSDIISAKDEGEFERQRKSMKYSSIGNEYAKYLIDVLEPRLVLCGHMHKRYKTVLQHSNGKYTTVVCLASVPQGKDSFEIFSTNSENDVIDIES